jgi:hypothetical protein
MDQEGSVVAQDLDDYFVASIVVVSSCLPLSTLLTIQYHTDLGHVILKTNLNRPEVDKP